MRIDKPLIIIATLALLGGAGLFMFGEWSSGVGFEGVCNRLIGSLGIAILGMSFLLFASFFFARLMSAYRARSPEKRKETIAQFFKQLGAVVVNVIVYGSLLILMLGGMSALDGASIATIALVLILWALCIAGLIAFHRYRKKHATGYRVIGNVAIALFLLLIAIGMLIVGVKDSLGAARDLQEGPKSADVFLVEADIDHPNWRYRAIIQTDHILTFYTADEERIVLMVPEGAIEKAKKINDLGNFVHLTYYPNTQVFCDATRWDGGRQIMGQELLSRLNEEYAFE